MRWQSSLKVKTSEYHWSLLNYAMPISNRRLNCARSYFIHTTHVALTSTGHRCQKQQNPVKQHAVRQTPLDKIPQSKPPTCCQVIRRGSLPRMYVTKKRICRRNADIYSIRERAIERCAARILKRQLTYLNWNSQCLKQTRKWSNLTRHVGTTSARARCSSLTVNL